MVRERLESVGEKSLEERLEGLWELSKKAREISQGVRRKVLEALGKAHFMEHSEMEVWLNNLDVFLKNKEKLAVEYGESLDRLIEYLEKHMISLENLLHGNLEVKNNDEFAVLSKVNGVINRLIFGKISLEELEEVLEELM